MIAKWKANLTRFSAARALQLVIAVVDCAVKSVLMPLPLPSAADLLNAVSRDLNFGYDLYLVGDGLFGVPRNGNWDGITADLMSGAAHLAFSAFSVTSQRVEVSETMGNAMCVTNKGGARLVDLRRSIMRAA